MSRLTGEHPDDGSSSDPADEIYFDAVSLWFVNAYIKIVAFVNYVQKFTKYAVYRIAMGLACGLAVVACCYSMGGLYADVRNSLGTIRNKEVLLNRIVQLQLEKIFLNDQQLFSGPSRQYLEERYGLLVAFLDKELAHLQVHHKQSDEFLANCTWFGLLITALPLLLNLSWWTTCVTIATSLVSAWFASTTLPSRYFIMTITNCSCGIALVAIHFGNLGMLLLMVIHKSM